MIRITVVTRIRQRLMVMPFLSLLLSLFLPSGVFGLFCYFIRRNPVITEPTENLARLRLYGLYALPCTNAQPTGAPYEIRNRHTTNYAVEIAHRFSVSPRSVGVIDPVIRLANILYQVQRAAQCILLERYWMVTPDGSVTRATRRTRATPLRHVYVYV